MAKVDELGEPKINNIVSLYQELDVQDAVVVDILTLSDDPALFNYFVGIEIDRPSIDCEQRIIPSGKYVVCSYEAENFESLVNEALYKASRYLYVFGLLNIVLNQMIFWFKNIIILIRKIVILNFGLKYDHKNTSF